MPELAAILGVSARRAVASKIAGDGQLTGLAGWTLGHGWPHPMRDAASGQLHPPHRGRRRYGARRRGDEALALRPRDGWGVDRQPMLDRPGLLYRQGPDRPWLQDPEQRVDLRRRHARRRR